MQLRDGLLQLDEHLVTVLDVVDRLTKLVLVTFDLEFEKKIVTSLKCPFVNVFATVLVKYIGSQPGVR